MPPRRSPRSRSRNAAWSALLTVSVLGVVEIGFRLFVPRPDLQGIALDYNADLMWDLASRAGPNITINSLGLRGPELQTAGHPRLLTLGDSSVFGDGVRYEQVFSTVAAATLATRGLPLEPVIGAIPGYSSFQAIRHYANLAPQVKPTFVVIGTMWSDAIRQKTTDAEEQRRLAASYAPWRPVYSLLRWPAERSATFAWMQSALHHQLDHRRQNQPEDESQTGRIGWITDASPTGAPAPGAPPPPNGSKLGVKTDAELSGEQPARGVARVPTADYAQNLTTLIEAAREHGATPMLLLLPHPRDDAGEELPARYQEYRDTMRAVATTSGAPLVDTERWFEAHPCGCSRFSDDIHPNAAGHAAMADALTEVLLTMMATPPG